MWENRVVKTTLELPDELFQAATLVSASSGRPLADFFIEALRDKLGAASAPDKDANNVAWAELFGAFGGSPSAREEARQIQQRIDAEFGQIDPLE